ncbi:MAG: hypothetical protein KJO53_11150 [Eudoraea sp.]|nr:hypothetical protein [Eudoraea sp.]
MINFFRRIRKKLADDNKPLKYARYAIGEILLVVIGILIALQINNWNEGRKKSSLTETYRLKIIEELDSDIENLTFLDSMNSIYTSRILNHISNNDSTKQKIALPINQSHENYVIATFYSKTYSINTLLNTGELSLFQDSEKQLIIQLKEALDRYRFYETTEIETVYSDFRSIKNEFDLITAYGYSDKLGNQVMINQELNDVQYYKYRNFLAEILKLYTMQSRIYARIKTFNEELGTKLKEGQS